MAEPLQEIVGLISEINDSWQQPGGKAIAPQIADSFSEGAVIVAPDLTRVARGREAVARSYDDFVGSATILECLMDDPVVDFDGEVGVATVRWRMRYRLGDAESTEAGYDVYVVRREEDRWRVSWRHIVSSTVPNQ